MACQWRPNTNCTELAGKPGRIQLFDVVENCNLGTDNIGGESIRYGKGIGPLHTSKYHKIIMIIKIV